MEELKSTTPHIDDIIYAMEQQSGKFQFLKYVF